MKKLIALVLAAMLCMTACIASKIVMGIILSILLNEGNVPVRHPRLPGTHDPPAP